MKIAISATGPSLDAEVDSRFGRCPYFIIVDPDTMQFESMQNSNIVTSGGAGIATGQMIAKSGVQVVLTGDCGPNAYKVLSGAGIQVITGVSGKIRDAIQDYKSGKFQVNSRPNVADHFGSGMGRGRGCGMGRGMGMGARMRPMATPPPQLASPEQELEALKAQSQMLAQQLADLQRRIEELEKKGE